MRQVPHYLFIGNGRLAKHFKYYFTLLGLSFSSWERKNSILDLQQQLSSSTHCLLTISDQAIEQFIQDYLVGANTLLIHFSGSLISSHAFGAHPLMSFNDGFYTLDQYKAIPFIVDDDAPTFEELLPGVINKHVHIPKKLKPKYHALCVLSGNFGCMLWQKFLTTLETEFNLPPSIAHPYFLQIMENLFSDHQSALSGPLIRGDKLTIEKNLAALNADPYQEVYKSFVTCHERITKETIS